MYKRQIDPSVVLNAAVIASPKFLMLPAAQYTSHRQSTLVIAQCSVARVCQDIHH